MDIDLVFRNWSLTFQYTKQFTQLGCTADLITGLHAEPLAECRIEYADAPTIFSSLNSFVYCRLISFVVADLLKPLCHNKNSVPFGNCFFSLSIHQYIASFRLSFLLSVSYTSYVSIAYACFGASPSDA
ncbi:MAG: hypothetical protein EZS28_011559 [Streblomastix strix]|uniref:Uncharacterized protein n=1 Tax=Streblomastix strix TaxID=222440 RepID=A0A5J4WDA2_9EUKA|nr:MAG: hypothetical protein EZS28_011559 [Streblomastix strix]